MRMKKKRKPRKRIGTSLPLVRSAASRRVFLPLAAAPKKKPVLDTYALVSGSVFNDSGFALPDADVTIAPEAQPTKTKPIEIVSDARGEFVIRVPPGPSELQSDRARQGLPEPAQERQP